MAADISVKIALDGERDYRQALKNCNDALKNADSALKAFDESAKGNEKSVENLQKRQELLSAALDEARKKQATLTDVVDKAKAARDKAAEALAKAKQEEGENSEAVKKAEKQYIAANNAVDRWETQLNKANEQVAKYSNEIDGATDETEDFQKVVGNTAAMEALTKIADKVSGVMKNVNKAASDAAKEIDEGYDTIIKKTGATGKQFDDLKRVANNIFGSMPVDIKEVGEAVGEVNTRFDLTGDALEKTSTAFLRFAEINGSDVTSAVDSVQKAMAAFGMDASEVENVLDVLTTTSQKTGVSVDTLSQNLVTNGTAFREMGLDAYEAADFMGGVETSGVDLNAVLAGMKKALKNATDEGKPLNEALADLESNIINGTDSMDGLNYAYDLFGNKAGADVFRAVSDGQISFTELANSTDILNEATGRLSQTYEETLDPWDKWQVAQNNLKTVTGELSSQFQSALTPAVEKVTEVLKGISERFQELPDEVQTAIGIIGGLGGKALEVAPQIASLVAQIAALKAAKKVAGDTTSLKTSLGNLAGKAGLVTGVIAAIASGIAYMSSEMDKATASSKALKEAVTGTKDSYTETKTSVENLDATLAAAATTEEKIAIVQGLLSEAQSAAAASTAQHTQAVDELSKVQDVEVSTAAKVLGAFGGINADIVAQVQALSQSSDAWKDSSEVMDDSSGTVEYLQGVLADLQAEESNTATETDALGDSFTSTQKEAETALKKVSASTQKQLEKVSGAVNGMKDALTNGAKSITNWFDKVSERETLSADELAANLSDQIESMKNWQSNLTYLADKGINQSLLQYLADMGPEGSAYVQAFVDAANGKTEVGLDEMNRLWMEKLDLDAGYNKEAKQLLQAVGTSAAGTKQELDKLAVVANNAGEAIPEGVAAGIYAAGGNPAAAVKNMNSGVNTALHNGNFYSNGYSIGANMVSGIVKGINNNASSAINAAAAMANRTISKTRAIMAIQSPSKVFEEIGMYLDQGLANGINKYSYAPDRAMTDTMKDLVQLPDLSRYDAGSSVNNEVRVYIGDKELTAIMAAGVVKNISTNQRARYAAAGG